jgi:hypothetical protein
MKGGNRSAIVVTMPGDDVEVLFEEFIATMQDVVLVVRDISRSQPGARQTIEMRDGSRVGLRGLYQKLSRVDQIIERGTVRAHPGHHFDGCCMREIEQRSEALDVVSGPRADCVEDEMPMVNFGIPKPTSNGIKEARDIDKATVVTQ